MANRKYTASQRAEATEQILTHGQPAALVARGMSVSVSTVHRWVSDALAAGAEREPDAARPRPAGASRDFLELQIRDAHIRLGQLEAQLERFAGGRERVPDAAPVTARTYLRGQHTGG
jgi:transposase-like protein